MRKIKVSRSLTDEELLEFCRKETGFTNCTILPGPTTEVVYKTSPPTNTAAVVVDISSTGGAMKVGEQSDNDLGVAAVGKVGTEDAENLVVVPWSTGWWFYSIGSVTIRYIVKT
ncbi:hypothetical protein BDW59DRAFT_155396 [Aspergillus cavernicola]|uniref:Uncharacterized protein n=1 Tax=Aspergillus cavernicola TaxID=176166 RepID=A0ABR4H9A0_9EURO